MGLPRVATASHDPRLLGAEMDCDRRRSGHVKDRAASPGGTTIAGLHAIEEGGLRAALMAAVEAAAQRSVEWGASS